MPVEFRRAKRAISFTDARDLLGLTKFLRIIRLKTCQFNSLYDVNSRHGQSFGFTYLTGMRDNEVNELSYDCYQTVQSNEHVVHVLMGYTSKYMVAVIKSTYWITFEDIKLV